MPGWGRSLITVGPPDPIPHPFGSPSSPQSGTTALYIASEKGLMPVVELLIAARANVEAKTTVQRERPMPVGSA